MKKYILISFLMMQSVYSLELTNRSLLEERVKDDFSRLSSKEINDNQLCKDIYDRILLDLNEVNKEKAKINIRNALREIDDLTTRSCSFMYLMFDEALMDQPDKRAFQCEYIMEEMFNGKYPTKSQYRDDCFDFIVDTNNDYLKLNKGGKYEK